MQNLGDKTILYFIFNGINGFVGVQNGKAEQPKEQRRSLFCTCDWGVVRCQSQHQCDILAHEFDVKVNCTGKGAWQLSIKLCVVHEAMNGCKILKIH